MQRTSECRQGTLFTHGGKTTLCGFAIAVPVIPFSQINQSRASHMPAKMAETQNYQMCQRYLVAVTKYFWEVFEPLPIKWSMFPSLEPGQTFMTILTSGIKQKWLYATSRLVIKRHVLVPCSFLEGSLHAVRKPNQWRAEDMNRCYRWQLLLMLYPSGNINCQSLEWMRF